MTAMRARSGGFAALVALVLAAACAGPGKKSPGETPSTLAGQGEALPPPAIAPVAGDACRTQDYVGAVGRKIQDVDLPADGPGVRRLWPDSMATMDFVETRLNILLDASGVITGLRCG